jgi:hypothetical protein
MAAGLGATRPASLVVGLAVGGGLATVATVSDAGVGVALTAVAGGLLGVVVHCRGREGPGWAAVAALLSPLVALAGGGGLALVLAERGVVGVIERPLAAVPAAALAVGVGLAALGAVGALGDGIGEGALARTWHTATATTAVVGLAVGVVLGTRVAARRPLPTPSVDLGPIVAPLVTPPEPTVALASFAALVAVAARLCRAAVSALPVVELTPRRRREAVRARVDRVDTALLAAWKYGLLAAVASTPTVLPAVRAALPVAWIAGLVAGPTLRLALLAVAGVAGLVALLGRLLRAAAGDTAWALGRLLPATAGGLGVALVAVAGGGLVRSLAAGLSPTLRPVVAAGVDALSPAGAVLGVALVALVGLAALLSGLAVAGGVGLVPQRGRGGTLAGVGLGGCAVLVSVDGAPVLATFALVGLGVVAWDVSERDVAVGEELGDASTARIEAVHAVASLGVAAVGVLVAWGAGALVDAAARAEGVLVGAVVAVAGAVVLLGVLRG